MKKIFISVGIIVVSILFIIFGSRWIFFYAFTHDMSTDIINKVKISNQEYYIRGSLRGIGGHEIVTFSTKKPKKDIYNKDEIIYDTSDLTSVYFDTIKDTIVFYYSSQSPDTFRMPLFSNSLPLKFTRVDDIRNYSNAKCIINYNKLEKNKT